jgi:hypothetical protein
LFFLSLLSLGCEVLVFVAMASWTVWSGNVGVVSYSQLFWGEMVGVKFGTVVAISGMY